MLVDKLENSYFWCVWAFGPRPIRYRHKRTNTAVCGQVVSGKRVRGGKVVGRQGEE